MLGQAQERPAAAEALEEARLWELCWAWLYDLILEARGGVDTCPHPYDEVIG